MSTSLVPAFVRSAAMAFADRLTVAVGGAARRRTILLLAGVLSLQSADTGAVGALAPQLETTFHIGNTQLGLLVTVTSLVGAVASLPVGVLTDRSKRVRLLVIGVVAWAAAMVATGLAGSYTTLLIARLALGIVVAVAGPVVASLTGDLFPSAERSRIYGFVLTGDLLGSGAGLLIAGNVGAALGWRAAFFVLAIPSMVLAVLLYRLLPEPTRGESACLLPDAVAVGPGAADDDSVGPDCPREEIQLTSQPLGPDVGQQPSSKSRGAEPDERLILRQDPCDMPSWTAARYVLRIPSNRVLIASSALGYFFLAGIRTFAVLFARGHYRVGQGTVSVLVVVIGAGAIVGTLLGGRLADRLIGRGVTNARLIVAGASFLAASVVFIPGFLISSLALALPFFVVGSALLAAPNPSLDAARLDVVPATLWGRAESVRTFVRTLLEAMAPLLFGFVSSLLGGGAANIGAGVNTTHTPVSAARATGLGYAFIIMLAPLAASGALLIGSRRRYLRDIATADESGRYIVAASGG